MTRLNAFRVIPVSASQFAAAGYESLGGRAMNSRVLVVESHPITRWGLARLLEDQDDLTVVGATGSPDEAVSLTATLLPDVVTIGLAGPTGTDCRSPAPPRPVRRPGPGHPGRGRGRRGAAAGVRDRGVRLRVEERVGGRGPRRGAARLGVGVLVHGLRSGGRLRRRRDAGSSLRPEPAGAAGARPARRRPLGPGAGGSRCTSARPRRRPTSPGCTRSWGRATAPRPSWPPCVWASPPGEPVPLVSFPALASVTDPATSPGDSAGSRCPQHVRPGEPGHRGRDPQREQGAGDHERAEGQGGLAARPRRRRSDDPTTAPRKNAAKAPTSRAGHDR